MLCWISAKAGEAIFRDKGQLSVMRAGTNGAVDECGEGRLHQLLMLATDIEKHNIPDDEKHPIAKVQSLLDDAWRLEWALRALVATVDRSLSPALRTEARTVLLELFTNPELLTKARRLFLSVPMPAEADTDWANTNDPVARLVAEAVWFREGAIAAESAWLQVALQAPQPAEAVDSFRRVAVASGALEAIRESLVAGRHDRFLKWASDRTWPEGERNLVMQWARETFRRISPNRVFEVRSVAHNESMFQAGEKLIYPNHGLAVVEQIAEKTVLGTSTTFYHLRVIANDTTVLVPVNDADRIGIRRAMSEEDVERLFGLLGDGKIEKHLNWKGRFKDNSDKMRSSSIFDVVDVLKSLTFLSKSKILSFREKRMLDRAKFLIIQEVSEVTGESPLIVEVKVESAIERSFVAGPRGSSAEEIAKRSAEHSARSNPLFKKSLPGKRSSS
jgi:CarD family transcriptional regulator, regulator of rRNA transcription